MAEAALLCQAQQKCGLDIGNDAASCEELYLDEATFATGCEVRAARLLLTEKITCARMWEQYLRAQERGENE